MQSAVAQNGLPSVAGGRGLAMGGAGITFTDIHSVWTNPAGLGGLTTNSLALYGEQRFSLAEIRQFSAVGAIKTNSGAFGINLGYYGFEAYNEQRIGLSYGRSLGDRLRIGLQVFALNTRIPEYGSKTNISFEFGLQAIISRQLSLAAKAHSPARIALLDDEYLPTVLSFGLNYQPSEKVTILAEVEKDIEFPARFRAGIEYELVEALLLRIGVASSPSTFSAGIGYRISKQWTLDFGSSYHQYLGFTPGLSLVGGF